MDTQRDHSGGNLATREPVSLPFTLIAGPFRRYLLLPSPDYDSLPTSFYEFDASTLEPVGAPFEGHFEGISGAALSSDGALLASASFDNTIKFWAFESRRLLASFDVINPYTLILSPTISTQLAYSTDVDSYGARTDAKIVICNIPLDILSNIGTAQGRSALPKVRIYSCLPCPFNDFLWRILQDLLEV